MKHFQTMNSQKASENNPNSINLAFLEIRTRSSLFNRGKLSQKARKTLNAVRNIYYINSLLIRKKEDIRENVC